MKGGIKGDSQNVRVRDCGKARIAGTAIIQPTLAAGANVFPLVPSTFGQFLNSIAMVYNEFRFTQLEAVCHPQSSAGGNYVLAYYPGLTTTAPSTVLQAGTIPNSLYVPNNETVPRSLFINRRSLISDTANKWWKCGASGADDPWDSDQGTLVVVGSSATLVTLEFHYVIEFVSAMSAASLPAPTTRRSIVSRFDPRLPIIDAYFPDGPCVPFPPGLSIDQEFKRVKLLFDTLHPNAGGAECARLALLR